MYWSAACWIILFHLSQVIYSSFAESQSADCVSKPALQWINPGQNKQNGFSIYLEGEWHEFDCRIANTNVSVNVTLWRKDPYYSNDPLKQIPPDGKHIAIKEKNVFRLPRLLESDSGRYYCKACQMQDKYVGGIIVYKGFSFARPNITIMPCCMSEYDYGSNVTLKCVIPAYRTLRYNMSWFKLGSTGQEIEMGSSLICCKHDEATLDLILSSLTKKDEGTYWCRIKRRNFEYSARKTARIIIKESIPNFSEFFNQTDIIKRGGERLSFNYKVSSNPEPNITWWKSKDGKTFESVASCANGKNCEADNNPQMQITRSQFSLINITYPEDNNVLFKCQAKNVFGNVSKSFLLIVYAKPQIVKRVEPMGYYKDMQINCTVKEANPSTVNFTWHSCDQTSCSEARWREISRDSSLTILRPEKGNIKYRCTAKNSAGVDQAIFEVIFPKQSGPFPSKSIIGFPVLIAVGSFTIFTLCIVFFVLWKRKRIYGGFYIFSYPPLPDYIEQIDVTKDVQEQFQKLPFIPEWEFPRERITLLHVLGRGEFGCVWLAHAIGISDFRPRDILKQKTNRRRLTVFFRNLRRNNHIFYKDTIRIAVKKLKENWDRCKLVDLQTELKVLIHVGEHENIVNVLGACTKGKSSDLWIIMEYCPHGNLGKFLRDRRGIYDVEETCLKQNPSEALSSKNLILFASQIARGMEFLISRKIIHRDLAARNVLIGEGCVAKIADFGLARNVYKYEAYVKKSPGLVPLKWMAIESIKDSIFTEKTDVWSFGILLWEIFTLGGTPYPGVQAVDLFNFLLLGNRMEPPIHCPPQISQIMAKCWVENPVYRPTSKDLVEMIEELNCSLQCLEVSPPPEKEMLMIKSIINDNYSTN